MSRLFERRRELAGIALAVLAAVCWASGALSAKWMFTRLPFPVDPLQLAAARAYVSTLLLFGILPFTRRRALKVSVRDLPFFAVFGIVGLAMVHFSYFKALSLTGVAAAILLEYLAPVLVLGVSVVLLGERLTWSLPVAVASSVTGCALMVGAIGGRGLQVSPPGIVWGLLSAAFFASYTLLGKRASKRFSPWTLLGYGLLAASLFWLAYQRGPGPALALLVRPQGLAFTLFISVFATIVPFAAFLKALQWVDATKASVTATLEPAVAGVLAFFLFGEALTWAQLLGAALVLAAIVVSQLPMGEAREIPPVP